MTKPTIQETVQERVNDSLERFISIQQGNSQFEVLPVEQDLPLVHSARYDKINDVLEILFTDDVDHERKVDDVITVFVSHDGSSISGFKIHQLFQRKKGFAPTLIGQLRKFISHDGNSVSQAVRENIKVNVAQEALRGKFDEDLQLVGA